jgi:hypothetical protein
MFIPLQPGVYESATLEDVVAAVVRHNLGLEKSHRIDVRRANRLAIICWSGKELCEFRVNAVPLRHGEQGVRITVVNAHSCTGRAEREQVRRAQIYVVEIESFANDNLNCIVKRRGSLAGCRVQIGPSFDYRCECKFELEFKRPCSHTLAAMQRAFLLTHDEKYHSWDKRWIDPIWYTSTWEKQHENPVKRVCVGGAGVVQTDLLPAKLPRKPGRKRKRPYVPSQENARCCRSCGKHGHYSVSCPSPDIARLARTAIEAAKKKAAETIIDLTDIEE